MYRTTIEQLCIKVTSGGTPSRKKPEFYTGDIPWIKTGELKGWYINDTSEKITEEAIRSSSAKIYPVSTVLMAMYGDGGTMGSTSITSVEAASNQACCAMIPDPDKCHPLYLLFLLQLHREAIVSLALGGAQRNLNQGVIKSYEVEVHELGEQLKIVESLGSYNYLIENNNRRIAILEDMAQSLYREWFVKFRFPGHENIKLKDSPLGQIPEGWAVKRLDDFVVLQRGFDLPKKKRNEEGGIPIYAASGINGYHDEAKTLAPGLVTGRSGTLGVVKIVLEDFWPLNTSLWVKEFKNCSAYYAYYLLASLDLERFNSGASVPTLNRNDVHGHQLISPPVELIAEFELVAKDFFQQIEFLTKKNKNLSAQRDMLLPKLISGNIEV